MTETVTTTPAEALNSPTDPPAPPAGPVLLSRGQVLARLSISDATLRRKMMRDVLPRPLVLGNKYCLRWREDEIDAAIARLARQAADTNSE
jgi:predicted DNA-binding transcriptional regulator AlpA